MQFLIEALILPFAKWIAIYKYNIFSISIDILDIFRKLITFAAAGDITLNPTWILIYVTYYVPILRWTMVILKIYYERYGTESPQNKYLY